MTACSPIPGRMNLVVGLVLPVMMEVLDGCRGLSVRQIFECERPV